MFAQIEPLEVMQTINPDILGAALILTVIGAFGALIAIAVSLIEAVKAIVLARLSKNMIQQLLDKGYSPQDVERMVHGQTKWAKMTGWMNFGRNKQSSRDIQPSHPLPPIKQPSV